MQQLLSMCSVYGVEHDIQYNAAKNVIMICQTKEDNSLQFPVFKLSDHALCVWKKLEYLGHIITDQMTDDEDIYRQSRVLYAQANILLIKFGSCKSTVNCFYSMPIVHHYILHICGLIIAKWPFRSFKWPMMTHWDCRWRGLDGVVQVNFL